MDFDDIVYLFLLFASIAFGYFYRTIADPDKRKTVGTLVGVVIVLLVSGIHIIHSFVTVLVNAAIILFLPKEHCHIVSFVFSFIYLFFFRTTEYFGIPYPPSHTNMIQMILTLRLVGLAFEVNSAYLEKKAQSKQDAHKLDEYKDAHKQDAHKEDAHKQDAHKQDAHKQDAVKQDADKKDAHKQDAHKQDADKQDAHKQDPHKEDPHKEDPHKEDPHKQDPHKQDPHKQDAHQQGSTLENKRDEKTLNEKAKADYDHIDVNLVDIFHYTFNYVGVIAGPYYKYRTFEDYFKLPFYKNSPWREATIDKIKYVPLYSILFLIGTSEWPLSYALSDEFYLERSWLYRFWYVWPNFFIFRMRMYIGLVLSECICTMAGLGAYPEFTEPKAGLGPSKKFEEMKHLTNSPDKLAKTNYSFRAIQNINPYCSDFCTTFREGMKHWNICVQYWLAVNIYKRFPNKKFRTAVTMFVSAAWHGVYTGYYVCIGAVPFYLPLEDMYVKLFLKDNNGRSLVIWQWVIWVFKMFTFSYLAIAFHLLTLPKIWYYYNSIYHAGLVIFVVLYVVGLQLMKVKKREERRIGGKAEGGEKKKVE